MTTRIPPTTSKPVTHSAAPTTAAAKPAPETTAAPAGWGPKEATRRLTSEPTPTLTTAAPLGTPTDPKSMDIVCPVLNALVGSGKLKMAKDGTVKFSDLNSALKNELGITPDLRAAALAAATVANPTTIHNLTNREFNVLELRSGRLKHAADSAILTGGRFDEAKFQALVSHAENGRMTETSFANAIVANTERDRHLGDKAAVDGAGVSKVEFGLALTAFGTKGPDGKLGIAVDDLRMLYQQKQIPSHLVQTGSVPELMKLSSAIGKQVDAQFAARVEQSGYGVGALERRRARREWNGSRRVSPRGDERGESGQLPAPQRRSEAAARAVRRRSPPALTTPPREGGRTVSWVRRGADASRVALRHARCLMQHAHLCIRSAAGVSPSAAQRESTLLPRATESA